MNTPLQYLKSVAIILSILLLSSCGMTPAEKRAQKELIAKQKTHQKEVEAKDFFSGLNTKFNWPLGIESSPEHYVLNYERFAKNKFYIHDNYIIEKGYGWRTWEDAKKNCSNSSILGLNDWRLPSEEELRSWNWNPISSNYKKSDDKGLVYYFPTYRHHARIWSSTPTTYRNEPRAVIRESSSNPKYAMDFLSFKSKAGTVCIHEKGGVFPEKLESAALSIINSKKPTRSTLKTKFPRDITSSLRTFKDPKQGEFENRSDYNKRFMGLLNDVNAYNRKLKSEYDAAYAKAKSDREHEYSKLLIDFEKKSAKHKADSFKEAFDVMHGKPILKNIQYNADFQQFTMNVTSEYGDFSQQLKIPLSVKYAPKFKKLITAKSFSPTVEIDVRNGEVFVTSIKEIADPALIVERDEYNKAKKSIKKLNLFISQYPKSKYVAIAKKQIRNLENIAEQKRLAAIEFAKDNADGEMIGTQNLDGAKYIAGKIWQDQYFNGSDRPYNYGSCDKLSLLGVTGWRLPSESEKLKYKKDKRRLDNIHFANRCVLSTYKYNKHAKKQEAKYVNENTLEGYINAFMAAGDDRNIRKAYSLATTDNDLVKVETALVKYFGVRDLFSLKGSLVSKKGAEANRGEIDASLLLNMISSSGNAELNYQVFPNPTSTVPLKYGSYKVRLKLKLILTYQTTALGFSTTDTEVKEKTFVVSLSPKDNWKASGTVDFGEILQGGKGAVLTFNMEKKLISITPIFDLISIDES